MKPICGSVVVAFAFIIMLGCNDSESNNNNKNGTEDKPVDTQVQPQNECTVPEMRCLNDVMPQKCVLGSWENQSSCDSGTICKEGRCEPKDSDGTVEPDCSINACKTAVFYKGDACINHDTGTACGCNSNSDCKLGFLCDSNTKICKTDGNCYAQACASQTSGYQGNVCITTTEDGESYTECGCNTDDDCKVGYSCDITLNICKSDCNESECKAMTTDYSGNVCITYEEDGDGYSYCGCHSDKDCRSGYHCNTEFNFCAAEGSDADACKPEKCAAVPDGAYTGNACVPVTAGIACGCNSDSDCRGEYICNYMGQCIIEVDISECKTDNDCKNKTGKAYYGNVCLKDYYGNTEYTYCGCEKNADCKDGLVCDVVNAECVEDDAYEDNTCDPSVCRAANVNYYGNVCISYYGYNICGCLKNSDCRSGYTCNTSSKACE